MRGFNRGASALLKNSRIGPRLGRAITTITYVGRRSGRTFSTPVAYRRDQDQVTIVVDIPDVKNWWRNFTGDGGPITLRLDGRDRPGHAVAQRSGAGWATVTVTLDPLATREHRRG
ncbi:MAG: nitroreductase/quinone reductase family protein [Mycobacterium sp.]